MAPIDWSERIANLNKGFSGIPKDVKFKIVEPDWTEESKTGVVHEVEAHRIVLAMASTVFHTMFFGSGDTFEDVRKGEIIIKETTKEAFETMVNVVYNTVSMEESLKDKSVDEVFAVLNLVTRYEIPELQSSVGEYLVTFPVTEETVLDVAQDSMEYLETFTEEVKELQTHCARYLRPKFQDVSSLIQFQIKNKDRKDVVHELLTLMDEVKDVTQSVCGNCLQDPCRHWEWIQEEGEIRVGMGVWGYYGGWRGRGRVISVNGSGRNRIVRLKDDSGREEDVPVYRNNRINLWYWCK